MWLHVRMFILLGVMFAIVYAIIVVIASFMGIGSFLLYGVIAILLTFVQYWISPRIVEWSMRVHYVSPEEEPELHRMVEELANKAGIKKPRVAISDIRIPNAFAFGRGIGDGRVCVTKGLLDLLDKNELKAVLGHEISHIRHRDMIFMTMLGVIPMILWYLSWSSMYARGSNRDNLALVGLFAFIFYFITNLLVLYASRIREYYADRGSIELGNRPHTLASALYKLVYGSASVSDYDLKQVEGYKAFFVNDPSRAHKELKELKDLDVNMSGTIENDELEILKKGKIKLGFTDRLMEILSTHPNMLKRIKYLSSLS